MTEISPGKVLKLQREKATPSFQRSIPQLVWHPPDHSNSTMEPGEVAKPVVLWDQSEKISI